MNEIWDIPTPTEVLVRKKQGTDPVRNTVLIIIPGNPGVVDYYDEFMEHLHHQVNKKIDIITVQHLGHGNRLHQDHYYGLQDQIQHKIDFFDHVKKRYPRQTQYLLAGHSIGAYMAIKVFQARQGHIQKVFPLFPTLHSMACTPNGRKLSTLFKPGPRHLATAMMAGIQMCQWMMPTAIRYWVGWITQQPEKALDTTLYKLLNPYTVYNALYLAHTEMQLVKDMEPEMIDLIKKNTNKFTFYYGIGDGWSPVEHYHQMKKEVPKGEFVVSTKFTLQADVYLCKDNIPHAFVLDHSDIMARNMSSWILKHLQ